MTAPLYYTGGSSQPRPTRTMSRQRCDAPIAIGAKLISLKIETSCNESRGTAEILNSKGLQIRCLLSPSLRVTMKIPTQEFSPSHENSPRSRARARRVVSNDAAANQVLVDRPAALR